MAHQRPPAGGRGRACPAGDKASGWPPWGGRAGRERSARQGRPAEDAAPEHVRLQQQAAESGRTQASPRDAGPGAPAPLRRRERRGDQPPAPRQSRGCSRAALLSRADEPGGDRARPQLPGGRGRLADSHAGERFLASRESWCVTRRPTDDSLLMSGVSRAQARDLYGPHVDRLLPACSFGLNTETRPWSIYRTGSGEPSSRSSSSAPMSVPDRLLDRPETLRPSRTAYAMIAGARGRDRLPCQRFAKARTGSVSGAPLGSQS